ncbi:heterocyst frequency control protein PatD [Iningainema tapete]|uniref:Heterocyst frequency control protein PatD n=1 Tax=Iningainema tapete BLCC-T55 TaxID=2748662 RepID=A0A8J6XHP3_9CYAN|nr:heterocyst frequency control protein PatD [Iningainema tapete]MBD2777020.1 heterocyst frequency control protein PatD [Iningainema tapete BLCC-T55]
MSLSSENYHVFAILIDELREYVNKSTHNAAELRQRLASLQQFFQQQIVPLNNEADSYPQSRIQSYQTEISKQLRLLEIDVMFFQGARQASTAQHRLNAISDRLTTLTEYCKAIMPQDSQDNENLANG